MDQLTFELLKWLLDDVLASQRQELLLRLDAFGAKQDAFSAQLKTFEEKIMATFEEFQAQMTRLNAALDNVHTDVDALKAEIVALKDQVSNMGLDATQEATILAGLTSIADRVVALDESVPAAPPPPEPPPAG